GDGTSKHPRLYISTRTGQYKCHNCNIEGNPYAYLKEFKSISTARERVKILESYNLTNGNGNITKPVSCNSKDLQKPTEEMIFRIPKHHDGIYDYRDEEGKIIYYVIKLKKNEKGKKRFIQFRPDGNGGFLIGRGNTQSLVYHLPELLKADTVIICEGEKDVDTIRERWKVSATCNTGGAGKWEDRFCEYLKGKEIIIVWDRDEPDKTHPIGKGLEHAWAVAKSLYGKVKSLKVVELPHVLDDEPIKDISNFIEHPRGRHSHFIELVKNSKEFSLEDIPLEISSKLADSQSNTVSKNKQRDCDNVREKYFDGKEFIPKYLEEDIISEHSFVFAKEQFYNFKNGVWKPIKKDYVSQIAAQKLEKYRRTRRIFETVESIRLETLLPEDDILDKNKDLINLKNVMLCWQTDKVSQHDKKHFSTVRINATFNKDADCPKWIGFLSQVLEEEGLINIVQEMFGYCLVPYTKYEKAFMLIGAGSNGKSTLLHVLTHLLGSENVTRIPLQSLGERFSAASLLGKLANIYPEIGPEALLETGIFKALVSGDPIQGERKYEHPFSFVPFAKLVFSCNELPYSKDRTHAFYRRWAIIPFNKIFSESDRNENLKYELFEEIDGIFQWSLTGLRRMHMQGGFSESEIANEALAEYRISNNNTLVFISERCELGSHFQVKKTELYKAYKGFCEENSYKSFRQGKFNKEIQNLPAVNEERKVGPIRNRLWRGIGIQNGCFY
ncbi:MAG: hypothetical protein GY797_07395, partial [Deltaproteobacteria bacterium]|nr:hypothetical protein [Deltaproteobacteria bacterium]